MDSGRLVRTCAVLGLFLVAVAVIATPADAECTTSFLRKFGQSNGPGFLALPNDVAIDSKGNIWVADTFNGRVQEFNSSGEFVAQIDIGSNPYGIAVDPEDHIWVVSFKNVREYKTNGELIVSFGSPGTGNGQLELAVGIAIDPSGNLWVLELGAEGLAGKDRVQKFNSKGEYLSQFGKEGTENGQFITPEAITIDSEGNILVADTGNNRVQEFNSAGEFVRKYGSEGTGNGQFKSPRGIAVDSEGKVWVTDSGNNRIERFSAKGGYLSQFGTGGTGNGQFSEPRGIAVSGSNLWVADTENDRVQELSCL
jgi:tripartite motif-containing protein 71